MSPIVFIYIILNFSFIHRVNTQTLRNYIKNRKRETMNPLIKVRIEDYYYALTLLDNEDLSISDEELLLLAEDYADLNSFGSDTAKK